MSRISDEIPHPSKRPPSVIAQDILDADDRVYNHDNCISFAKLASEFGLAGENGHFDAGSGTAHMEGLYWRYDTQVKKLIGTLKKVVAGAELGSKEREAIADALSTVSALTAWLDLSATHLSEPQIERQRHIIQQINPNAMMDRNTTLAFQTQLPPLFRELADALSVPLNPHRYALQPRTTHQPQRSDDSSPSR